MWVFFMDRECECRVLGKLNIFLIQLLKFTKDHKLQMHLSRNELFGVGPVVHTGVFIGHYSIRPRSRLSVYIIFYKYTREGSSRNNVTE